MAEIDNDTIMNLLFDSSKGPLENVLSLVEKGFMFLGWWNMAAVTAAKLMGYSLSELGAYLDKALGLKNANDLTGVDDEKLTAIDKTAAAKIPMSNKMADDILANFQVIAARSGGGGLVGAVKFLIERFSLKSGLWGLLAYRGIEEMKKRAHSDDNNTSSQKGELVSEIDRKTNSKRKILEKNLQEALSGS